MLHLLPHGPPLPDSAQAPASRDPGPTAWLLLRYLPAALWGLILSGGSGHGPDAAAPPEVCFAPSWPGPVTADVLLRQGGQGGRGVRLLPVVTGRADAARLAQVALAARRALPGQGPGAQLSGVLHLTAAVSPPAGTLAAARDLLLSAGAPVPLLWRSWASLGAQVHAYLPRLQGGERLAAEDLLRLLRSAGVLGFHGLSPLPSAPARPPWRYAPQGRRYFQGMPALPAVAVAGAAPWRYPPVRYFAAAGRPHGRLYRYHQEQTCPPPKT